MEPAPGATAGGNRKRKPHAISFARRLFIEWWRLQLPQSDAGVIVAVSGGADSTALLLGVVELVETRRLGVKVTVAHLDHGLRGEQGAHDARWVSAQAARLRCEAEIGVADVRRRADAGDNLEQAARRARYEFLRAAAEKHHARYVLTGHTMNDQAETLLLRLMRGGGTDGLSGIPPLRALAEDSEVRLARPLLRWARRVDTENYCRERGVEFCFDSMNDDESYARVRVRRKLIPLMETFNPRVVETLARTAGILREDADALREEAFALLSHAVKDDEPKGEERKMEPASLLRVDALVGVPRAVRRNALRQWLERERGDLRRLELVHVEAVEKLLEGGRGGRVVELPGGARVERRGRALRFFRQKS